MKQTLFLLTFLVIGFTGVSQTKYFNTFTLINNGEGTDVRDNIKLAVGKSTLSMNSKTFTFENAQKTGENEMYNDSKKGDMVATQYKTNYYEIVLMRYINYPNEVYLKIIDLVDSTNYLIHLHNK
jgi:hypothetical protein